MKPPRLFRLGVPEGASIRRTRQLIPDFIDAVNDSARLETGILKIFRPSP